MTRIPFIVALALSSTLVHASPLEDGAHLDAAVVGGGGEVKFGLKFEQSEDGKRRAFVLNGEESIEVPIVEVDGETLLLRFDYFDSEIRASIAPGGALKGEWRRRRSLDEWSTMPFHAEPGGARTADIQPPPEALMGRWRVRFEQEKDEAVAIFDARFDRRDLRGTFLTTTGDYRFLAGMAWDERREGAKRLMRLSCFDGSHAFLFTAQMQADGTLAGDFWSGPTFHDTWTAVKDEHAALPDPFALTSFTGSVESLDALTFTDIHGASRSLGEFKGKARIIEVFGTWCPNCLDATHLLRDLDQMYGERGLNIVGIAFEVTGNPERDRAQVRTYAERHGVRYPLLIAGKRDKAEASKKFPVIDRLRAYPTFIFVDGKGTVRGVYTGFSGPATGEEHDRLKRAFREKIETMLTQ